MLVLSSFLQANTCGYKYFFLQVNFSEPLSMLQRMSEDLAHSGLLTKAALSSNTMEEAAFVAAYINSAYGRTNSRVAKPFNPMLYETFECDRRAEPGYGWRLITEQVCSVTMR